MEIDFSLFQKQEDSGKIHLWVTNKLSDRFVSFTRYFNVTSPDLPELQSQYTIARQGYFIVKHRNNIAWCEKISEEDKKWYTCITLFEIDQDGIRKEAEIGRCEAPCFFDPLKFSYVYIPSLIPVPE
ncbi:putative F-box only protein 15 [Cardamine amara subsp. amara]|uniref:F-box only protein 15 n=1 Tax=Cardamine amara subsp. amara TaxID=228776 RepID=A0ABD0ZD30_CARAN